MMILEQNKVFTVRGFVPSVISTCKVCDIGVEAYKQGETQTPEQVNVDVAGERWSNQAYKHDKPQTHKQVNGYVKNLKRKE